MTRLSINELREQIAYTLIQVAMEYDRKNNPRNDFILVLPARLIHRQKAADNMREISDG